MIDQQTILRELNDVMEDLLEYHFKGEKALSSTTAKLYERLIEADRLMKDRTYPERADKVKQLQKLFGVSLAQARKDMIQAAELFNRIDSLDLASCMRLLLGKIQQYEKMCYETGNLKEGRHYLQLELDLIMKIKDAIDEGPQHFAPTINIYTSGKEAQSTMNLADRRLEKITKLIMSLPIEDDVKEKELNVIGVTLRK